MIRKLPSLRRRVDPRRCAKTRLELESLEDRFVLSSFTVNSVNDAPDLVPGDGTCASNAAGQPGPCTLRAAVMEANALFGADTIVLDDDTYTLSIAGPGEDEADTGDLDITDELTIGGVGRTVTVIDGGFLDRVFDVHPSAGQSLAALAVNLNDLTVQHGLVQAAFGSSARGGGILSSSALTLTRVLVSGNAAQGGNNGEIPVASDGLGGGIFVDAGSLTLLDTAVADNVARGGTGIGTIAGRGLGGGLVIDNSQASIVNTTIADNTATGGTAFGGGPNGIALSGDAHGGGIFVTASSVSITSSTIARNTSQRGSAPFGGQADGGGISNDRGQVTITNSTISGNATGGEGGGMFLGAEGGFGLRNVTVFGNSADQGGGIFNNQSNAVSIENTILAGNIVTGGAGGADCFGSIQSLGHNLIQQPSGCSIGTAAGDIFGADPNLAPLGDYGGPTQTHLPRADSPALDQIDPDQAPATDQRGVERPQGPLSDIGSCELNACSTLAVHAMDIDVQLFTAGAEGGLGVLRIDYQITQGAASSFDFVFFSSADAFFDMSDVRRGPSFRVTSASDLAVGPHTILIDGGPYAAFLTDLDVPFFLAVAQTAEATGPCGSETDTSNNDRSFIGVFHHPQDLAPLIVRGRDDTDRYTTDDPNDHIEFHRLNGSEGASVEVSGTFGTFTVPIETVSELRVLALGGDDEVLGECSNLPPLSVRGGTGNDSITATASGSVLQGEAGDDLLQSCSGDDLLSGGSGRDTADFTRAGHAVRVDLPNKSARGDGTDALDSIEDIIGSAFADSIIGDGGANRILGQAGDDTIRGGRGADIIDGGSGDDHLFGDNGDVSQGESDQVNGGPGDDSVFGDGGNDSLFGGTGNDTLCGQDGNDREFGEAGDDRVVGGLGNDELHGGDGNDLLEGCEGRDQLLGDAGNDVLVGGTDRDSMDGGDGSDTVIGNRRVDSIIVGKSRRHRRRGSDLVLPG